MPEELVAYGHPTVVFFHVFFKVAAVLVYMLCGIFNSIFNTDFVSNFVICVLLLMLDFWTTKNVSGRILVGLRWWNEVTDEGSNWRFETYEEGQRLINKKDAAAFWWLLYIMPFVWILLGVLALVRFKIDYLLVIVVAVVLSGANLIGYIKCSKEATQHLKDMAANAVTSGLTVRGWPLKAVAAATTMVLLLEHLFT